MKEITNLLDRLHEKELLVASLKHELAVRETLEYKKYIANGGNARTAKDKVLQELKLEQPDWQELEVKLDKEKTYKNNLTYCLAALDFVDDVPKFIKSVK